jgi:very-short-patch-repair endonuclease
VAVADRPRIDRSRRSWNPDRRAGGQSTATVPDRVEWAVRPAHECRHHFKHEGEQEHVRHADVVIDELAARQHGVVARAQLGEAGVSKRAVDRRIASGQLKVLYRGVYRAGPVAGVRAREIAAALACGPAAVVSHASAAAAWQFMALPSDSPLHVTVPALVRRRVSGILVHRARDLKADEVVRLDGVPLTTPARTVLDLAKIIGIAALERAVAQAERRDLVTIPGILTLVNAHPRHRGTGVLRKLLEGNATPALTRSEAESRLLELIRKARLRAPRTNVRLLDYEVDFLWPAEKLIVEVDGYAYHSSLGAFARDRRRDAALTAAGHRVVRFTWHDIVSEPELTLTTLVHALLRSPRD